MAAQQAGWIDRVFNSTIALPQQVLWRIIRAMKDEDIDLFSEKGLLDAANIPLLGVLDDHKEDVMPDYMAKAMGMDPGLGQELFAAIASDPLTYLTGGLSATGKVAKAANGTKMLKSPVVEQAMKAAGASFDSVSLSAYDDILRDASGRLAGHSDEASRHAAQGIADTRRGLAGLTDAQKEGNLAELLKQTGDRQIAIGVPGLYKLGAKIDVFQGHRSWWSAFTAAPEALSKTTIAAWATQSVAGVPWIAQGLSKLTAPARQFAGGIKYGTEARAAIGEAATEISDEALARIESVQNPDSALALNQVDKQGVEKVVERFDKLQDEGLTPSEAFSRLFGARKFGPQAESVDDLWKRVSGEDTFSLSDSPMDASDRLTSVLERRLDDVQAASERMARGDLTTKMEWTEVGRKYRELADERLEMKGLGNFVSDLSFRAGKGLREMHNRVFRSGTTSDQLTESMHQFESDKGRSEAFVGAVTTVMSEKIGEALKAMPGMDDASFNHLIRNYLEATTSESELIASLQLEKINPTNARAGLRAKRRFLDRHQQAMKALEVGLTASGVTDEVRKSIGQIMRSEVFDALPLYDDQALSKVFDDVRRVTHVPEFTPAQTRRMGWAHNEHRLTGTTLHGQQVGALSDGELRTALSEIDERASRPWKTHEVDALVRRNKATSAFIEKHGLQPSELTELIKRKGKGGTRRLSRAVDTPVPMWRVRRKNNWGLVEANKAADDFGFRVDPVFVDGEIRGYRPVPTAISEKTALRSWGFVGQEFETVDQAMRALREFIQEATPRTGRGKVTDWAQKYARKVKGKKQIEVPATELDELKAGLTADDLTVLEGKGTRFSNELLEGHGKKPSEFTGTALDRYRIQTALSRRGQSFRKGLTEADGAYDVANVPEMKPVQAGPRPISEEEIILEKFGKEGGGLATDSAQLSGWARSYATAKMRVAELDDFFRVQDKIGASDYIPEELLNGVNDAMLSLNSVMDDMVLNHLPKEARQLMDFVRQQQGMIFEGARKSGVWTVGSPVGYLGRYMTQHARKQVAQVVGEMDAADSGILKRIGLKIPSRFARSADTMTIDDLNEIHTWLRETDRIGPNVNKWAGQLESIMEREGLVLRGFAKSLPWSSERISGDPFASLIMRLGQAQQDESIEKFIGTVLAEGTGTNGQSNIMGGKVVGVLDDKGRNMTREFQTPTVTESKLPVQGPRRKAVSKLRRPELIEEGRALGIPEDVLEQTNPVLVEQIRKAREALGPEATPTIRRVGETERTLEVSPKFIVLETDQGKRHIIPAREAEGNGFGWMDLGDVGDAAELGYQPTAARSFVNKTLTAKAESSFTRGGLSDNQVREMIGKNVLYGAENVVVGAAKSVGQSLQISSTFMRNFDNVNYMIKSFQTVMRVPFHVANAASGVFQANLAGVSPKNLAASYVDAFRFFWGKTDFIERSDMIVDTLGVPGWSHGSWTIAPHNDIMQFAERMGGSLAGVPEESIRAVGLDRHADDFLDLGGGRQVHMKELFRVMGQEHVFSSMASSLTRGSRTIGEQIFRLKFAQLDPDMVSRMGHTRLAQALKKMHRNLGGGKGGQLRETSEGINRTATMVGLVREGHTLETAAQMTKAAHVPYERLTPIERNYMKRALLYYTFPRHYAPFAWSKFMENPQKLAEMTQLIKSQRMITTEEGSPALKLGDYRVNVGRLNANLEAALMVGAFADIFAQPMRAAQLGGEGTYPYDPNVMTRQLSAMGLDGLGGVAGLVLGADRLLPQGARSAARPFNSWDQARSTIWPIKLAFLGLDKLGFEGGSLSREEQSPFVDFTPMERRITDSDFGLGVRKVRPQAELRHALYQYKQHLRQLKMLAAATTDREKQERYRRNAATLAESLKGMATAAYSQEFK